MSVVSVQTISEQTKRSVCRRLLFCLLLAVLVLPLWTETGTCAEGNEPLNTSGNMNRAVVVDPIETSEGYSAVLYNHKNGLPTSEVNAVAQTPEGFLWIGSYSGLIRYDGNRFERIESGGAVSTVRCLFVDSRGRMWIGTNDEGVFLMENGEIRELKEEDSMFSDSIRSITEDKQGRIYIAGAADIATIDADMKCSVLDDERVAGQAIRELRTDSTGLVYGVSNTGGLFVLKDGKVLSYYAADDYPFEDVLTVLPDPEQPGVLYVGTEHEAYRGSLEKGFDSWDKLNVSPLEGLDCLEYIDGQIWICARNGIGKLDHGTVRMLQNIPMDNAFCGVMTDMDGYLWIVSDRQGVMKIVPNRFTDYSAEYGLPGDVVNSTCMADGQLFVGTNNGLTVTKKGIKVDRLPVTNAVTASGESIGTSDLLEYLNGIRIRSIIRDSGGRIWISTAEQRGLIRYDQGVVTQFSEKDGLCDDYVRVVSECEDGSMLVATNNGISVIKGDRVVKKYGKEDGIDVPAILTIAEGYDHEIIAGSDGGGVYLIDEDGVKTIGAEADLTSEIIMRVKRSRTKDLFWIITGDTLAAMTPDHKVTIIRNSPYANNFDLYENSKGELWLLSSNGIDVISSDELLANDPVEPMFLGIPNGLPYPVTANSHSELTADGMLFISGDEGVIKVNIEKPFENVKDMRIVVPYLDADGERCLPDKSGGFVIPADTKTLKIYPYVIDYSLIDPSVSYCLEGFDREDTAVNRSDLRAVTYTNLPGGSYRFTMKLDGMTGGGGGNSFSISIAKQKTVFEYLAFKIGMAAAVLLLLGVLSHLYHRRKMRVMEEKHQEAAERERISKELALATRIQSDMLPDDSLALSETSGFDISASMNPAKAVGGDFYDYFLVDDDHLCMVMADVSGKGIPAALFMMASKIVLADNAKAGKSPAQIMTDANVTICANNKLKMFVTVWLGILELSTGKLVASNAGHEYPVIKQPDGPFEKLQDKHCFVLGGIDTMKYTEYELTIKPGTKLFLYTDGIPEAENAEDEMFGMDRMLDALNAQPDASPEQTLGNIHKAVEEFVDGAEQFDDLTMLCMEYKDR